MSGLRRHCPSFDFEGYGVYEFDNPMRGYGQLPPGVSIDDVLANMNAYITSVGGIQVATINVQQPIMDLLDKMDFDPEGSDTGPTVRGTARFVLFSFGSDFASEHLAKGYAIMGDKASVKSGNPKMLLTQIPQVIADNAFVGGPYVVVTAPSALLDQAAQLKGSTPGPGPVIEPPPIVPPVVPPTPGPTVATAGFPTWVFPVVIGASALAFIAVAAAASKKR